MKCLHLVLEHKALFMTNYGSGKKKKKQIESTMETNEPFKSVCYTSFHDGFKQRISIDLQN